MHLITHLFYLQSGLQAAVVIFRLPVIFSFRTPTTVVAVAAGFEIYELIDFNRYTTKGIRAFSEQPDRQTKVFIAILSKHSKPRHSI